MKKEYAMRKDFCVSYVTRSDDVDKNTECEELRNLSDDEIQIKKDYYRKKMADYPKLLNAADIKAITGYSKEGIRKWINSEKILGVVVHKRFCVAKEDLLDFLISPYYDNIIRKCEEHKKDCINIKKTIGG